MSEGLESLKEISEETIEVPDWDDYKKVNIKKVYKKEFNIIEKELKALEIIKPFLKNIRLEENEKGEYEVLIDVVNNDRPLVIARVNSKEEYDLLKEVILWVKV